MFCVVCLGCAGSTLMPLQSTWLEGRLDRKGSRSQRSRGLQLSKLHETRPMSPGNTLLMDTIVLAFLKVPREDAPIPGSEEVTPESCACV